MIWGYPHDKTETSEDVLFVVFNLYIRTSWLQHLRSGEFHQRPHTTHQWCNKQLDWTTRLINCFQIYIIYYTIEILHLQSLLCRSVIVDSTSQYNPSTPIHCDISQFEAWFRIDSPAPQLRIDPLSQLFVGDDAGKRRVVVSLLGHWDVSATKIRRWSKMQETCANVAIASHKDWEDVVPWLQDPKSSTLEPPAVCVYPPAKMIKMAMENL